MTANQRNILAKLVIVNLGVYGLLGLGAFGGSLIDQGLGKAQSVAIALQQTLKPATPTFPPTRTSTAPPIPKQASPTIHKVIPPPSPVVAQQSFPVTAPQPALAPEDGLGPSSPLTPADAWRTLGAGARIWYKVGSGGEHIDVFLEGKPLDGLSLEVYAPGQLDQPIGHGTLQAATNRLVWAGGHWQSAGDWLGRVTNSNPVSVQYKLVSSGQNISNKSCYSYWESLGNSSVYWTKCE
jgi:hypothetical protein